jgi:hypothetical protein
MTRNWIVINIVLVIAAGLLGWRLYSSIKLFKAENNVAKIQPAHDPKQKISLEGGMPPLPPLPQYNAVEYGVVPNQNLFSDTRTKEEKPEAAPAVPEVLPLVVKPILVGVTLVDDQKMASVIDPTTGGASRRSQTRRLGDTYQNYTITDITPDQMVLERLGRREVIPLFDSGKHPAQGAPAQSGKTPILPTRVIAFGGGGGSAGQGVAQPVAGGARLATVGTPTVPAAQTSPGAQTSTARGVPVTPVRPVPGANQPGVAQPAGGPVDQQGRRVIRTPFGDIPAPPNP